MHFGQFTPVELRPHSPKGEICGTDECRNFNNKRTFRHFCCRRNNRKRTSR